MNKNLVHELARIYYEFRPLHYVLRNGQEIPVPWDDLVNSDCPVRKASLARHLKAIEAVIKAQLTNDSN